MRIAVMQPYIFPYIGYFQLIHSVESFVFYDDVNYINKGWVNRNRILLNNNDHLFVIPLNKASQNKLINEIDTNFDDKFKKGFFSTIDQSYKTAPFYQPVRQLIEGVLKRGNMSVASLAINSIVVVCEYLGIDKQFYRSSENFSDSRNLRKHERLIEVCRSAGYKEYVNAYGGLEIYNKEQFKDKGIDIYFLKSKPLSYRQSSENFVPGLSIIDVLMYNSPAEINNLLPEYDLI